MQKTFKIVITGRVQGVGFRPHVYLLARSFGLTGTVSNNEEGVIIYVSGKEGVARSFYNTLIEQPSRASRILDHRIEEIDTVSFEDFRIVPSEKGSKLNLQLTPDLAICEACAAEIRDPKNRRYNYPFTTCVHCGPRWAVTKTFPFERENTTLAEFEMCPPCLEEYTDPANWRFHSQTNSCPTCGISYWLTDSSGNQLNVSDHDVFTEMARMIREGKILAIRNTSGYLLCCDATSEAAVNQLRHKKQRPDKPFALMYPSMDQIQAEFVLSESEQQLLTSPERPIVILNSASYDGGVAYEAVAPGLNQLGVMLPYTGVMQLLTDELDRPIVATSGNLHGSPILSEVGEAEEKLGTVADYFLHHNLPIANPQDDSVIKISRTNHIPIMFRRSRGYAPNFSRNNTSNQTRVLALGGHLKSTIALLPNDFIYVSEYLGVLDNAEVYDRFCSNITKMLAIFEQESGVILVDKHPAYQSTLFGKSLADKLDIEYVGIQHHKAHFAAIMGEHSLFDSGERVLGVVWDGTGYGDDGNIWGGEFFLYENAEMERVAHFEYFDWLAGDKMSAEPRLSLFSLTEDSDSTLIASKFSTEEIRIYKTVKEHNSLKTSSVGRLFDAVASLLGLTDHNNFEGQAAILLENRLTGYDLDTRELYTDFDDPGEISTSSIWSRICQDHAVGKSSELIIENFLYTLASAVSVIAKAHGVQNIAFSGGVFQNTILTDMINDIVGKEFKLYFHQRLSPNDENISLGQLMYYLHCTPETDEISE